MADKSFVLLGVNSDPDRANLQQVMDQEQIRWRSWWDNGRVDGPIQTHWQVAARPTIYILDREGVIRFSAVGITPADAPELDRLIDDLLRDAS